MGSIPAYKGFHPHSLGNTNYAYMREKDGWVLDIQEKQPYTDNKMEEYASSGTYYFSTAREMSAAFAEVIDKDYNVNSEYYVVNLSLLTYSLGNTPHVSVTTQ